MSDGLSHVCTGVLLGRPAYGIVRTKTIACMQGGGRDAATLLCFVWGGSSSRKLFDRGLKISVCLGR